MARYDYKCNECEHEQITEHPMSESPEVECEKCGSKNTQRIIKVAPKFGFKNWP